MEKGMLCIFEYLDYRMFIKQWIETKKKLDPKFSYRYYSAKAGFSSSNFLSLVVKGKRNLTIASVGKIAKGFALNKQERSFFENMVFMNQASTHEEKDHYFQRMLKSKPFRACYKIDASQYNYFSNWYNLVVREMVAFAPRPVSAEWIASQIQPEITPRQAQKALELLLKIGMIEPCARGGYSKKEAVLTTGSEVRAIQITNFHKEMAGLADSALDRLPPDQRDISGLVLSLRRNRMPEIKEKIDAFRNELAEMAAADENEDAVFYVQIRAFPLTRIEEEK